MTCVACEAISQTEPIIALRVRDTKSLVTNVYGFYDGSNSWDSTTNDLRNDYIQWDTKTRSSTPARFYYQGCTGFAHRWNVRREPLLTDFQVKYRFIENINVESKHDSPENLLLVICLLAAPGAVSSASSAQRYSTSFQFIAIRNSLCHSF